MAITSVDTGRMTPSKMEQGVQTLFLENAPLLELLPKVTNGSLTGRYRRIISLPVPSTRRLYQAFPELASPGYAMQAYDVPIYGGMFRIDEQLLSEPGGADDWADTVESVTQGMAFTLNYDAINGDRATTPDAMDGLKVQIAAMPSSQTIVPSSAIDLTTAANRKTNATELLRLMDLAFQRVRRGTGGNPDIIVMDDDTYNLMADAFRQSGFLDTTRDNLDREYTSWKGAKIVMGGFVYGEALTQSTATIGSNFDGDGNTSMLFLRSGTQYCRWVQKHALKITEGAKNGDGSTDDAMVVRAKKVEWPITIHCKHPFGAARLKKLKIV
jgi:hypothetical protein